MPKHPRLFLRNNIYYHRASIPVDIADSYPKTSETFSLRTRDPREAVVLVRRAAAEVDARFEAHRASLAAQSRPPVRELTPEQISALKDAYFRHLLEEDEDLRLDGFEELDSNGRLVGAEQFDPRPSFEEHEELTEDLAAVTRYNLARGKQDDHHRFEAEDLLSWHGIEIKLAHNSPSWPRLIRAVQEAHVQAAEAIQRRNSGEVVSTPQDTSTLPVQAVSVPLLSALYQERRIEADRAAEWGPKLIDDYDAWVPLFIEFAGDKPILSYTKRDARAFKNLLMGLPSNRQKHAATKGRSAVDCLRIADETGMKRISKSTVNKGLSRLQGLWRWADKQLDEDVIDIFGPMKLKKDTRVRDERDPFSSDQLKLLFSSPLYTGCLSERRRSVPGPVNMSGTPWYWLPLLGLLTGARLNELCQLRLADVQERDGIPFLSITETEEDQRVKGHKEREVPLHPTLVNLGFLRYVEARRLAGDDRVFPTLKLDAKGYYSAEMSKDFSRYLTQIGAKTDKTAFHSLRHSFKDACRDCGVPSDIIDILQGHSLGGMADRYGTGKVRITRLADEIEKISFGTVADDVTMLHR